MLNSTLHDTVHQTCFNSTQQPTHPYSPTYSNLNSSEVVQACPLQTASFLKHLACAKTTGPLAPGLHCRHNYIISSLIAPEFFCCEKNTCEACWEYGYNISLKTIAYYLPAIFPDRLLKFCAVDYMQDATWLLCSSFLLFIFWH